MTLLINKACTLPELKDGTYNLEDALDLLEVISFERYVQYVEEKKRKAQELINSSGSGTIKKEVFRGNNIKDEGDNGGNR